MCNIISKYERNCISVNNIHRKCVHGLVYNGNIYKYKHTIIHILLCIYKLWTYTYIR